MTTKMLDPNTMVCGCLCVYHPQTGKPYCPVGHEHGEDCSVNRATVRRLMKASTIERAGWSRWAPTGLDEFHPDTTHNPHE